MKDAATPIDVLVVGSGAGGAVTALELASFGLQVVVLEEGPWLSLEHYGLDAASSLKTLFRRQGMTPILGRVPIGYVEGACVGGSTEVNSGFWHRTPRETLLRWQAGYSLEGASEEQLRPHFDWAEAQLSVGLHAPPLPKSTTVFLEGIERMGWSGKEIPRAASGCENRNRCASGCPSGAKRGVGRTLIPLAEAAGARVITFCRVRLLLRTGGRVTGVLAERRTEDGQLELIRIDAHHVFVCAGPTETPALLRRSGIKHHIGDSLRIHPMLKVVARFPFRLDAHRSVLPLAQIREFWPELSLGGAYFTPGHAAMMLSEHGSDGLPLLAQLGHLAAYYVAVRGTGQGTVRSSVFGSGDTTIRYELSDEDRWNVGRGLARLATLLLAAGAEEVLPCVAGLSPIRSELQAIRLLDERLPAKALSLTTVHAFSSCPMGERSDRCAVDSYGKVRGLLNLYLNDASILPDSPGVNPQGTIMALARRNVYRFLEGRR